MSNFSEWGVAELALTEVPDFPAWTEAEGLPVSGVKSGSGASGVIGMTAGFGVNGEGDGTEAPAQEFWLPVTRRSTGEQIGVLLVEAQRMRV